MPFPEYSHLLTSESTSESDDIELFAREDDGWHPTILTTRVKSAWLSESTAWRTLTVSLVLSLTISAVNLTLLSAWTTPTAMTAMQPLDYPNVYIGLERVARNSTQCLSRGVFPDTFYTYDARKQPSKMLKHVHAPEDEVTLVFGGPIRTVVETRILDYGLENCTFIARSSNTTHSGGNRSVDVYLLPTGKPGDGQDGVFLDRLALIPGKDSMSHPFHCPSRSRVRLELRCGEDDCTVQMPLQGVTSRTASSVSVVMAGFRINQYEAVDCIARSLETPS